MPFVSEALGVGTPPEWIKSFFAQQERCTISAAQLLAVTELIEQLKALKAEIGPRDLDATLIAGSVLAPVFLALDEVTL